ncbi:NADH-quinone oxidoreductase subunit J [Myxococcota bacterium]|nr:NADH-quinone oxidoreductase subunit J [Myxococcota bacterium]
MLETILFYLGAAVALAGAIGTVSARTPLRGALSLIVSLTGVAGLFVLLSASFVAAMQLLVYAGAVVVLFTFVIMLLNLDRSASTRFWSISWLKALGALAVAFLVGRVMMSAAELGGHAGKDVDGHINNIGRLLLSDYLFGFEAISILLLVAVVGAVVLGQKRLT